MSTFHPFPRLPFELRAQIWESTIHPRVVDVRAEHKYRWNGRPPTRHLASRTPAPAPLHTCREARKSLYQRAFTSLANPDGSGRQYVWLNLDVDVVSIGTTLLANYAPAMLLIQRLKFEREHNEFFARWESDELRGFTCVKEIHLVCAGGMWMWHYAIDDYDWPCEKENVWMVDPDDDRAIRGVEMQQLFDAEMERMEGERDSKEIVPDVMSEVGELPRSLEEVRQTLGEGGWRADIRWI